MDTEELRTRVHSHIARLDPAQLQGLAYILRLSDQTTADEAVDTQVPPRIGQSSHEENVYRLALRDFIELQRQFLAIRETLREKEQFIEMAKKMGDDVDRLREGMRFATHLDHALEAIINLMQYDSPSRHDLDIRNGFRFSSGSMNYVRSHFNLPEKKEN